MVVILLALRYRDDQLHEAEVEVLRQQLQQLQAKATFGEVSVEHVNSDGQKDLFAHLEGMYAQKSGGRAVERSAAHWKHSAEAAGNAAAHTKATPEHHAAPSTKSRWTPEGKTATSMLPNLQNVTASDALRLKILEQIVRCASACIQRRVPSQHRDGHVFLLACTPLRRNHTRPKATPIAAYRRNPQPVR